MAATAPIPQGPVRSSQPFQLTAGFRPPALLPKSDRAFKFHMAYVLFDAVSAGIMANAPLMAVKAMSATDVQLQIPVAMTSLGLFASLFTGAAMAQRRKKPFVVVPGMLLAVCVLLMAWIHSALWFLVVAGVVSIFDFALRPAFPSVLRIIYPAHCRAHVAGTMRQYASVIFLAATLFSASLLQMGSHQVQATIRLELSLAGVASLIAFFCFSRLPNLGDGSLAEAMPGSDGAATNAATNASSRAATWYAGLNLISLAPWRDRSFRRYLITFFLFSMGNLFYMGIVPAFFAHDLGYGYVRATLFMHIIPGVTAFLLGGRLTSWFDRTSIWKSYAIVALLWGLDPVLLGAFPSLLPVVVMARVIRGPATVGSMVLAFYTGVHSFARPGPDTTRFMAAQLFVNGLARLVAPIATALLASHMSHRAILLCGGSAVLAASALFRYSDRPRTIARTIE